MRIGTHVAANPRSEDALAGLAAAAADAADRRLDAMWTPQLFDVDALSALAIVGREVPALELGTAVTPVWLHHPVAMASQALTAQAALGGRLSLGLGLSHKPVVESVFGMPFHRPATYMRDYLSILMPLLHDGEVHYRGELLSASTMGPMRVPGAAAPSVVVAALGPRMLRIAGELSDGTITWMVGPKTLESHIVPAILAAAADAGRRPPRVVVGMPVCVTADPAAARERAATAFAIYGQLPSYRAMLDREGAPGPADIAVIGDEEAVADQLRGLAALGATDLTASVFGSSDERRRTMELLGHLAAGS